VITLLNLLEFRQWSFPGGPAGVASGLAEKSQRLSGNLQRQAAFAAALIAGLLLVFALF